MTPSARERAHALFSDMCPDHGVLRHGWFCEAVTIVIEEAERQAKLDAWDEILEEMAMLRAAVAQARKAAYLEAAGMFADSFWAHRELLAKAHAAVGCAIDGHPFTATTPRTDACNAGIKACEPGCTQFGKGTKGGADGPA